MYPHQWGSLISHLADRSDLTWKEPPSLVCEKLYAEGLRLGRHGIGGAGKVIPLYAVREALSAAIRRRERSTGGAV